MAEAKEQTASKKDSVTSHVVEALELVASRVVFVRESDARDFRDHLVAAENYAQGNNKEAKEAEERIAERLGDSEASRPAAVA